MKQVRQKCKRVEISILIAVLAIACLPLLTFAQNDDGTIRVDTRVVFVDALVKEKKSGVSVGDLAKENFEVRTDGKQREIEYFSREGDARRRPLALMLVLDLRYVEILDSINEALKRLAPEDEVAVVARVDDDDPMRLLTDFTRDRTKISDALTAAKNLPIPKKPIFYVEELKSILQKLEPAATLRPDSEIFVVPVASDVSSLRISERNEIAARLIRGNISFSPLLRNADQISLKMKNVPFKMPTPRPLLGAIGRLAGVDNFALRNITEQTGGDALEMKSANDYGAALEKLIEALAARYNLGFALEENEKDDGRLHKLEVKVKAKDKQGKKRDLIIRARHGFFLPKT